MFVNSSSSLNVTLVFTPIPSSISNLYMQCIKSVASTVLYSIYTFTNLLLLAPLYIFILYIGVQRWRHHQNMSHTDFFTYHMIAVEIFGISGSFIYCVGMYTNSENLLLLGLVVLCVIFPGQTLFHSLTCVEHYLAAVHPISYMRLRETGGLRIKNISILCAWLLCFMWVGITYLYWPGFPSIPLFCMLGFSFIVTSFCCLSVVRVLIRPGPREVGNVKEQVDQSKQRAFNIIRAIMVALLLRIVGLLLNCGVIQLYWLDWEYVCALLDAGIILTVPSSLVLPLLFLQKTGKLACCRCNTKSG